MHEQTPPLLAALAQCESQEHQARQAGIEAGETKARRKTLAEDISSLERQQRLTSDEQRMGTIAEDVARLRDEYATVQTRFAALQQLRVEVENRAMHLREGSSDLAHQAWVASQTWKQATVTIASADASAYARHLARAEQGRARRRLVTIT